MRGKRPAARCNRPSVKHGLLRQPVKVRTCRAPVSIASEVIGSRRIQRYKNNVSLVISPPAATQPYTAAQRGSQHAIDAAFEQMPVRYFDLLAIPIHYGYLTIELNPCQRITVRYVGVKRHVRLTTGYDHNGIVKTDAFVEPGGAMDSVFRKLPRCVQG